MLRGPRDRRGSGQLHFLAEALPCIRQDGRKRFLHRAVFGVVADPGTAEEVITEGIHLVRATRALGSLGGDRDPATILAPAYIGWMG